MAQTTTQSMTVCSELHQAVHSAPRHAFPFDQDRIPLNGVYVLFEKGEYGHQGDRIVRVGSHTGSNQLRPRLKQHFLLENKDRSIFRKNIGRAILSKNQDPFLKQWEYDLTTRYNKERYFRREDMLKSKEVERQVSHYIQDNFSFAVFEVEEKERRLALEQKMISTVSLCTECRPSEHWLGQYSPKAKIRESGLWLVNQLYKTPLNHLDLKCLSLSHGVCAGETAFCTAKTQRSDWDKHEPMPLQHKAFSCSHNFTPSEYLKIQKGVLPEQMEDKWFIYFEEDKLYFHRSWTGYCIYIAEFEKKEDCYQMCKLTINRAVEQYTETDDKWDMQFVIYLVKLLLLRKSVACPQREDWNAETAVLHQWSLMGRAILKDIDGPGTTC